MSQTTAEKKIRRYQKSEAKTKEILVEAKRIFTEEGYDSLTFSNLANRLGIRRYNIQYYFESIDVLVREMIRNSATDDYKQTLHELSIHPEMPAEEMVEMFVGHFLREFPDTVERNFYIQMYALAVKNDEVSIYVDELYDKYIHDLASLIQQINPALTLKQRQTKAEAIVSLIDGAGIVVYRNTKRREYSAIKNEIQNTIMQIIFS